MHILDHHPHMHQHITASSMHFKIHLAVNCFSIFWQEFGRLSKTETEEEKFQIHSFTELKLDNEAAASKLSAGPEFCPLVRKKKLLSWMWTPLLLFGLVRNTKGPYN